MGSRSACHTPEVHEFRRRPPDPLHPAIHWRPHNGNAGKDQGKALLTKRMASASPLRNVDTNKMSPARNRPVLSATASMVSGTTSLPATPLDDIPQNLWPRVIRTATTPETSTPELSLDDITSTKLSLDDQVILTGLPRNSDRKEARGRRLLMRTSFGNMWEENNGRFKKMTRRLKSIPSGLFTRRNHSQGREIPTPTTIHAISVPEPSPPQPEDLITEAYVPATRSSSEDGGSTDSKSAPEMDYECKPKDTKSRQEEIAQISSFIRKDLYEARNRDRIVLPSRFGIADPLPRHFLGAPTYDSIHSASAFNPVYGAEDRLLHGPRSLKAISRRRIDRAATSVASVEEMRTQAFGSRRTSRPSLSGVSFNHSSAPSISRTSYSTSRPATHSGSISSCGATLVPQKPRVFMDTPNASSESLWRLPGPQKRPSISSTTRPGSNEGAAGLSQGSQFRTSAGCEPLADIRTGFEDIAEYSKFPILVPRWVDMSGRAPDLGKKEESSEDARLSSLDPRMTVSTPTFSDKSFGSLSVGGRTWSSLSHIERRAEPEQDQKENESKDPRCTVRSRAKALYTFFQGNRR